MADHDDDTATGPDTQRRYAVRWTTTGDIDHVHLCADAEALRDYLGVAAAAGLDRAEVSAVSDDELACQRIALVFPDPTPRPVWPTAANDTRPAGPVDAVAASHARTTARARAMSTPPPTADALAEMMTSEVSSWLSRCLLLTPDVLRAVSRRAGRQVGLADFKGNTDLCGDLLAAVAEMVGSDG